MKTTVRPSGRATIRQNHQLTRPRPSFLTYNRITYTMQLRIALQRATDRSQPNDIEWGRKKGGKMGLQPAQRVERGYPVLEAIPDRRVQPAVQNISCNEVRV